MMSDNLPLFGVYEKALHRGSFEDKFEDILKAGYDSLEFSVDGTDERLARLDWELDEIVKVRRAAEERGVRILTLCLSAHKRYSMGNEDPEVRAKAMEILEKALRLASHLGVRMIQYSGFDVYEDDLRNDETHKWYVENTAIAAAKAEREGVMLSIEPVEGHLLTCQDTIKVVNEINSPFLQIYPDPANILSLGVDPLVDLEYGRGHITAVHMRDSLPGIYDATIHFGTGNLDFDGVFRKLDELSYHGPFIVEMWNEDNPEYIEYLVQAREYMTESINRVRSMGTH